MNISDYLRTALLNHALDVAPYTHPSRIWAGLYTTAPTSAGGGSEVGAGDYVRVPSLWSPASLGVITNSADIRFPASGVTQNAWSTVASLGLFDSSVNGNLLFFGPLSASVTLTLGDDFTVPAGSLTITLA